MAAEYSAYARNATRRHQRLLSGRDRQIAAARAAEFNRQADAEQPGLAHGGEQIGGEVFFRPYITADNILAGKIGDRVRHGFLGGFLATGLANTQTPPRSKR
jgi:hypothetical protein